eukprot:c36968_g1_i1 orf=2-208(-)
MLQKKENNPQSVLPAMHDQLGSPMHTTSQPFMAFKNSSYATKIAFSLVMLFWYLHESTRVSTTMKIPKE